MDKKQQTIDTYNATALRMAKKFDDIGARVNDIEETFALVLKENPFVFEIGCGNGRDALEICKRTNNYLGIDIAKQFIEIARKEVPVGRFELADVEDYDFPQNIDIVFAFASLIHVPKESLVRIMNRMHAALESGGVARISMKQGDVYREVVKEDAFGVRTYYFYSQQDMEELSNDFTIVKQYFRAFGNDNWIELLLQK